MKQRSFEGTLLSSSTDNNLIREDSKVALLPSGLGDTLGWSKGVVFINGQNLGRYWSIGPQQTLYLPAPWLHTGINEVIVFEEQEAEKTVHFVNAPDLGMAVDVE
ncbi:Beta-galactosidase-1-like protein 2 [Acipenser ruthenus]|uniref:Beta-galactosidase-1-like protein 2 n=1 Tax=Acipenser ruthenus TaxID=7906 RepID=A0A444UWP4_ACIRT|nr:Beta-galactosidase-1-like protein 2 [Acipenser ruthenus]